MIDFDSVHISILCCRLDYPIIADTSLSIYFLEGLETVCILHPSELSKL